MVSHKIKNILSYIIQFIQEEYKFMIFLIFLFFLFEYPVDYYIVTGGGTSDVSSRIQVEDSYPSKGSFHISYVTELQGSILTYLVSYIIPTWEREDANLYKYTEEESIQDIEFRSDLDLKTANSTATYWAYTLAGKKIEKVQSALYVITVFDDYNTPLKVGDQILSINGEVYDSVDGYREYLQTREDGEEVSIDIIRNKKEKTISSKLYSFDNRLILGVGLQFVHEYKTDPSIEIAFRSSESGPSGGLISTLEIYNQLTKKDITHGLTIAGTGTIEEDGTIGEIGGVEHKLLGASKSHADVFLVPSGENYKDALQYKKEKKLTIKLVEVHTIQEALEKLEDLS